MTDGQVRVFAEEANGRQDAEAAGAGVGMNVRSARQSSGSVSVTGAQAAPMVFEIGIAPLLSADEI
jgi:hypothetical protein